MKKIISNDTERHDIIDYIKNIELSKPYVIEIKRKVKKRSTTQNAYLHVCITLFAIELGYTIDEAKTLLKRSCEFMVYEKNGNKFLVQTRSQTSKEQTDFIEWIRNFSAKQGIYIPTANEYDLRRDDFDNIIEYNKQYL